MTGGDLDADGDGTISLQEFQVAHEPISKAFVHGTG